MSGQQVIPLSQSLFLPLQRRHERRYAVEPERVVALQGLFQSGAFGHHVGEAALVNAAGQQVEVGPLLGGHVVDIVQVGVEFHACAEVTEDDGGQHHQPERHGSPTAPLRLPFGLRTAFH